MAGRVLTAVGSPAGRMEKRAPGSGLLTTQRSVVTGPLPAKAAS